ncbi:aldo/keto reductase [Punctularia strigosozonata HHB-11173 SS5]|uniref:aldo/keto reductase n=1 Tax=Punctularia strigosozonata (strain HHB-11173) TaxID=741275 RepID=UPI00044174BA|nr:aldo/keto reductase [Punctularia strigosozonata HHB-11173 SS5]EIN07473.1 aldo/keto reductase [Punctularia strigosozonata HHB-11173 SS5]
MTVKTMKLGGTASNIEVAKIGHGIMMMTFRPTPIPDEQCFETIKAGCDQLPSGAKMFINAGEFYAQDLGPANLELLARFYAKYPEYAEKTFLSVKGGATPGTLQMDGSPENLKRSVDFILEKLGPHKRLDLFECARVVQDPPIEEVMKTLLGFVKEGKFDHIGISECGAATLRRANAVAPIVAAEIEVSPWAYEEETKKVIATAKELGIAIIAYSPLGHGFLTGKLGPQDLEAGDHRVAMSHVKEGNWDHNVQLVETILSVASRKGITAAQLCLAWVGSLGSHVMPIPGSSSVSRKLENLAAGEIELSETEVQEIADAMAKTGVKGERFIDAPQYVSKLWA